MMENKKISIADIQQLPTDTIGHDLLRYIGLQDLIAQENDSLLYYIGKRFARKFDINSIEDIALIFHMMKWGHLDLVKEKKKELHFHLMSDELAQKLNSSFPIEFRMEAGFLSEAISILTERTCECTEEVNKRLLRSEFKVLFID